MALSGTAHEKPCIKAVSKLKQIQALFPLCSCWIRLTECSVCNIKPSPNYVKTPEQCQWIAVCMDACRTLFCFCNYRALALIAPHKAPGTAGTRNDQITSLFGLYNATTDPCCMPQIQQTGMFTRARHWYTVAPSGSLPKRVQVYVAGQARESMHVYSACFPAAPVVRPLTGSDVS